MTKYQRFVAWWDRVNATLYTFIGLVTAAAVAGFMLAGMLMPADPPATLLESCEVQSAIMVNTATIQEHEYPLWVEGCMEFFNGLGQTRTPLLGGGGQELDR